MLGQRSWGPRFSRVHPAERSTRLGRWTAGAIPGGSLAHCSSSCEANTGSPSPRGRGVPSVGNRVGPSGGPGSWPRRLGCGQGGLVAQGPGLPEREERKAELWVLEEHQVGARGAPAELRARLRSGELSARPRGPGGRSAGVDEGPAGVRSLRFWSCSLARQRGKAKVAEQGVFLPCGAGWCGCFL